MSKAASDTSADGAADGKPAGGKKKLILIAVPVLLLGVGAGLWFSGILPNLLGMGGHKTEAAGEHGAPAHGAKETKEGKDTKEAKDPHGKPGEPAAAAGVFFELPDVIANLNTPSRRIVYVKLKPRLELAKAEDEAAVRAALPRLMDLFQTYLREMRPEELHGSIGTYRLREALLARANVAVAPAKIVDVLFAEMIIQ